MKKLCKKITKQQWRITVPNMNSTLFKKSPSKDELDDKCCKRSSGSYDVQAAERKFDQTRSLPSSMYVHSDTSSDSENDKFSDAREGTVKSMDNIVREEDIEELDNSQLYVDVEIVKTSKNINEVDGQFEYDVPRISFKFFDKNSREEDNFYEKTKENSDTSIEENTTYEIVNVKPSIKHKSEVKIVVTAIPEIVVTDQSVRSSLRRSLSQENFVSAACIVLSNSLDEDMNKLRKCGSDPNLPTRHQPLGEEDEGLYMVPRCLTATNRFSQSLREFDSGLTEDAPSPLSNETSIEHISCSQVIVSTPVKSQSEEPPMEYCKTRSKLPLKFRRPSLMRKSSKATTTWNNFRSKLNNLVTEHAAQQRVGAFHEKDGISINLEEMYKNSKTKCRKVLKNTGKIFSKSKKRTDSIRTDSKIVRNEVFFEKGELKASDIVYKLNITGSSEGKSDISFDVPDSESSANFSNLSDKTKELESMIKSSFRSNKSTPEGQNGFDDLRRYVKQGSDFCKELSTILQDRAEAETTYAKSLSKLSSKLSRACREGVGGLNEAWKAVAIELEARAETHRVIGASLLEESAKPLRTLTEQQQRNRKIVENVVDKAAKSLADWRSGEAKSKKHNHTCARENEKLQDVAVLDNSRLSRSTSLIQIANMHQKSTSEKENAKLEGKKRKAEDAVKKADIEYYTLCVRAERARLEWESAVLRGVNTFQSLEEERLNSLKNVLASYLLHSNEHGPKLIEATEGLRAPVAQSEPTKDLSTFINLRQSSHQISEQLLPDFYCEHITLAMNRERRKQALIKLLHLIRQDIERERKSKNGLENLSKAIKQTPNFGAEDSQQNVTEKLYHMKSMLTYLEAARYKVHNALAEMDSRPRSGHPLAPHITVTRDKSGLQQSVLKVPQWLREEWFDCEKSPISQKSINSDKSDKSDHHVNDIDEHEHDWSDRGAADGNSNQPDSDFDEFSSQCSSAEMGHARCGTEEIPVQPIAYCKALYPYTPNLNDELPLKPGDVLSVYRQQDDGWWLGECNGSVGIFPATYVEIVST